MFAPTRTFIDTPQSHNESKSGTPSFKYVDWGSNIQLSQEGITIRHPLWQIIMLIGVVMVTVTVTVRVVMMMMMMMMM